MWPQQVALSFLYERDALAGGRSISKYRKGETVFSQGKPADAVFSFGQKIETTEKTGICASMI